jgi:hypothetical protein
MLDFTIINPSTNLSAIGNPTKSNHKITKTLGNIIQMQFPEVQINKTKCPKKLEN